MVRRLSIVVPAHNEERRIGKMLDSYLEFFRHAKDNGLDFEIVVVMNACTDKTKEVILKRKAREVRIMEFKRGGKGFAVIEGFRDALLRDSDVIGFVDADASTSPAAFYHLMMHLPRHDGVIASRYVKGAVINPAPTFKRRVFSRMYNAVMRAILLLPYRDTQCGAKIFTRKAVESILPHLSMSQWGFDVELLFVARKQGLRIAEIPTLWSDREYSKVGSFFVVGTMMFLGVLRLRLIHSPFKPIIRVYDTGASFVRKAIKK